MSGARSERRIRLDRIRIDQELSFAEAAAALGRKRDPRGEKLRNLVLAHERRTGRQIAIRLAGSAEPKLRITLGALYRGIPELRASRTDALAAGLRLLIGQVDERTESVVQRVIAREVLPRLQAVERKAQLAEAYLRGLAEQDAGNAGERRAKGRTGEGTQRR